MIRGQMLWRGVTFGIGTDIELVNIDGLEDLPDADYTGTSRPRLAGAFPGEVFPKAREIKVEFEIVAGDTAVARKLLRDTTNHTKDGITEPLTFLVDDTEIHLNAQLIDRTLKLTSDYAFVNNPIVRWTCPDPRRYGAPKLLEIPFPDVGDGVPYPFPYPTDYVDGEPGERAATNNGEEATPVVVTLPGPCSLPWVRFTLPGGAVQRIELNADLATGQTLVLDSLNGTALVGNSNRRTQLTGTILSEILLPPGDTTIAWGAFSGTPDAALTVAYADAEM